MNLDVIRVIDKWVGIPACFVLSAWHKILTYFKVGTDRGSGYCKIPQNVLFIELSEMGSAILAYPAMRHVLDRYPQAKLYFLTFTQNRFSVDVLGIIPPARVVTIDPRSSFRFLFTTLKATKAIRKAGIDTVFDLELFSRFSSVLSGFSKACRRIGYGRYHEEGLYRGGFMTHRVLYNSHQHMAKNFVTLVKSVGRQNEYPLVKEVVSDQDLVQPRYNSSETDLTSLWTRLAGINPVVNKAEYVILLNPSAGRLLPIRAWPIRNYVSLAKMIIEQFNAILIIIGLQEASEGATRILNEVGPERCIDFTGQTLFKDLVDLLNLADLLVTADSGPAHFAALTSIRSVVLFGPETPELYAPMGKNTLCLSAGLACSPCLSAYNHRKTSCTDPKCMEAIAVDEVFDVVSSLLPDSKNGRA